MWFNSGKTVEGRDGCRTPLPWDDSEGHGFTTGTPWLPFGKDGTSVAAQEDDPLSMLAFYRSTIELRRSLRTRLGRGVTWLETSRSAIGFTRELGSGALACVMSTAARNAVVVELPAGRWEVVLDTSGSAVVDGRSVRVPHDSTVWLQSS
jgi:alpha-glucosidase